MLLNNKTIIITGASRGIGKALAHRLMKEEVNLVLVARSQDSLQEVLKGKKNNHKYYVCDLSDKNQTLKLAAKIKKDYQSIDMLINVAGIGVYKPIGELTYGEWDHSFDLNVTASFILIKELMPLLCKNKDSLVMNIGSGAGVIPMKNRVAYCSTKFAMRGMTLSLAEEYKDKPPFFCLITLGSTLTEFGIGNAFTLKEKIEKSKQGSAYFTTKWVADKLVEIMENDNRQTEYVFYPGDYGMGTWKKP